MSTPIKVGIAGFGTVGQGVWKHLTQRSTELQTKSGREITPVRVAVKDMTKQREVSVPETAICDDALSMANDPEIDVLCELMGGVDFPLKVVEAALRNGKTVVTANKALLCDHGDYLHRLAKENNAHLFYEASVAGGIPIIKALKEGLVVNRFPLIYGILNGTCNYILTRMEREGKGFETILDDARRLGYVEADESLDLDGLDAAHKAIILAYLAHGTWIPLEKAPVEGIREVQLEDIQWAENLGYKIKLLAVILRDFENDHVFVSVQPCLVPKGMILASVDDVFNGVAVTGDVVGESVYIGRGAGQDATASSVISDLVDASIAITSGCKSGAKTLESNLELAELEDVHRAFYVRMIVDDKPGVLAEVASVLADYGISIENLLQRPNGGEGMAHLILTTHLTSEAAMEKAAVVLGELKSVLKKPFLLRIADFEQSLS